MVVAIYLIPAVDTQIHVCVCVCVCVCISIRAEVGQTKEENGGCSWDWEKGWPGKVGQTKEEEGVEGIEFSIHVSFN